MLPLPNGSQVKEIKKGLITYAAYYAASKPNFNSLLKF